MIHVETKVKIPFLWGKSVFNKDYWNQINLIVGPNGSGKTLLAQSIARQFQQNNFNVQFIHADRTYSQEEYSKQLQLLKENETIKAKVETVLSNMFGKSIKFIEDIDETLLPIVTNKAWNVEYMLTDVECHGLKEILVLLINLYDTNKSCLIFDEPELHLHPQFQMFFANEIRRELKLNPNRIIFLITHSPFFIDLRYPEDLLGVIVCHINRVPTHLEELSQKDDELFRRFLPRFNTYHKQFFFSDNQIFVEGYTDQQLFSNLLPFLDDSLRTAGTGVIDVGGKDELGVFFKVCALLGTDGRIITDLDSLFSGKLRDVFCQDERSIQWFEKQKEKQQAFFETIFTQKELTHPITLEKLIYKLERYVIELGQCFFEPEIADNQSLSLLMEKLNYLQSKHENPEAVDTYKTVILQSVFLQDQVITALLPESKKNVIQVIKNLASLVFAAAEASRIYILHKGCIEHYYKQTKIFYMPVSAKDRLFHSEIEHILNSSQKQIYRDYEDLITLLEKAVK